MKVAVVGCGGMGRVHAESYARMDGAELVGVCDIDGTAAGELAAITGARPYQSFERLLEETAPEAVSIALPSHLHKEYALKAAAAGKHVICEKPIALTLEDADAMIEACRAAGVSLFVGHVVRFFPEYEQLRRQLADGRIGVPGVVHAKRGGGHPAEAKSWFGDADKSGGVIVDMMIHDIDFVRWTLGEPKSVYALNKRDDRMDYALVTLEFRSGAAANLEGFWGYPGPFHYAAEFAGSEGVIRLDSTKAGSLTVRKAERAQAGGPVVEIPQSASALSPYDLELAHFLACLRDGSEPAVTAADAREALRISLAALESIRTGLTITL
ncbi:Gfo/Idh/MocA family protein [Paenibacillus glycinis]|uniref:Gfo/Idh/MocA family oxidoreductase n=1 Tax=Paenibacillus glycinis TaxID=2697035 RepID=A0ABW9XRZ3_9BACL|nr:Gfo/Idh/MocA family oxidoreductase [Paenibacillus glycinis]NBD25432.1 Gfo/Idh/MocA family oxidoreductase [Paenibacillus glycinis]